MIKYLPAALVAIASACFIAWMDTRPHWNDTGVTVGAILLASALCGALSPARAWLWALIIGGALFGANLALDGNYESAIALAIAFLGAYAGAGVRKLIVMFK
jgi:hypothetical protein